MSYAAICYHCNKPMRHNVPRLGTNGGFVHSETSQLECGPKKQLDKSSVMRYDFPMNTPSNEFRLDPEHSDARSEAAYWKHHYSQLSKKFQDLDQKTEFFARSVSISDDCYGCERHGKDFMVSFLAQDHKYLASGIDKVFDLFLDRADLEKLIEEAQKLLKK